VAVGVRGSSAAGGPRSVRGDTGKVHALVRTVFGMAADFIDVSTEVATAVGIALRRVGRRALEAVAGDR
jgi:hypothetical protein